MSSRSLLSNGLIMMLVAPVVVVDMVRRQLALLDGGEWLERGGALIELDDCVCRCAVSRVESALVC